MKRPTLAVLTGFAILLLAAGRLASEKFTVTTVYPVPSGAYATLTANRLDAKDVRVNGLKVVNRVLCAPDTGLSCSLDGHDLVVAKAACAYTTCSARPPGCGATTAGIDNCGKPCMLQGSACVGSGAAVACAADTWRRTPEGAWVKIVCL